MERLFTPKQRANAALKLIRAIKRRRRLFSDGDQQRVTSYVGEALLKQIDQTLSGATEAAFDKAGLDIEDIEDWKFLLPWLAWAIFDKSPGRRREWSKKELRRLLEDVNKLRSDGAKLKEEEYCEQLMTEVHYLEKGVTAGTLRRRLQEAKKLDLKQKK
jgi:hypothetical protein